MHLHVINFSALYVFLFLYDCRKLFFNLFYHSDNSGILQAHRVGYRRCSSTAILEGDYWRVLSKTSADKFIKSIITFGTLYSIF